MPKCKDSVNAYLGKYVLRNFDRNWCLHISFKHWFQHARRTTNV